MNDVTNSPDSMLYLAYGSNLHPLRLQARLPNSRLVAVTTIDGFQIAFNKRGQDGSGKCNLIPGSTGAASFGALYRIDQTDIAELDQIESGYRRCQLSVELDGSSHDGSSQIHQAFTYKAKTESIDNSLQPFVWYHSLVMAGARFLNFELSYQQQLRQVAQRNDSHPERSARQHQLLRELQQHGDNMADMGMFNSRVISWELSS